MASTESNSGHSQTSFTRCWSPSSTTRTSITSDATVRVRGGSPTKSVTDSGHGHSPSRGSHGKTFSPIKVHAHPPSVRTTDTNITMATNGHGPGAAISPINTFVPNISDSPLTDSPPHTPTSLYQQLHRRGDDDGLDLDFDLELGSPPPTARSEHRWSDVVPPQTALTFAAVYDPSEGLITFSGASLLPSSSSSSPNVPSTDAASRPNNQGLVRNISSAATSTFSSFPPFPSDGQSQVLTINDRLGSAGLGCGGNGNGMITPALSTAQFTTATSEGMADMRSLLDTYFKSGTKQQQEQQQFSRPWVGGGIASARASSALEGPMYGSEGLTNLHRHVRVRSEGDIYDADLHAYEDKDEWFKWSWVDRVGEQLILDPSFDRRYSDAGEKRRNPVRVDSGYADEDDDSFAQRQALDSARHAQINRLHGVRRGGFQIEDEQSDDDECFDPNEHSRFSVTTTSTSNYVQVGVPMSPSSNSAWSALEAPSPHSYTEYCRRQACASRPHYGAHAANLKISRPQPQNGRLQKKSNLNISTAPAKPEDVLARREYNHESPIMPSPTPIHSRHRMMPSPPPALALRPTIPSTPPPPVPTASRPPLAQTRSPSGKSAKSAPPAPPPSSFFKPKSPTCCRFTRSQSEPNVIAAANSPTKSFVHGRRGSTDSQEKPKSTKTLSRKKSVIEKLGNMKKELVGAKVRDEMWVCVDVRCEVTQRTVSS